MGFAKMRIYFLDKPRDGSAVLAANVPYADFVMQTTDCVVGRNTIFAGRRLANLSTDKVEAVSREHLRITYVPKSWKFELMVNSMNGCLVNGTFLENGRRKQLPGRATTSIRFGRQGPCLQFVPVNLPTKARARAPEEENDEARTTALKRPRQS